MTASSLANRSVMTGLLSARAHSSWIFFTTSEGVLAGAKTPYHCTDSKPLYPDSATVGTSGKDGKRLGVPVAMARKRPFRMYCSNAGVPAEKACVRPANKSVSAGPVPR